MKHVKLWNVYTALQQLDVRFTASMYFKLRSPFLYTYLYFVNVFCTISQK
jgi:hypothetical protein